jgi:ribosomal 30S subunit maturation factor RimM
MTFGRIQIQPGMQVVDTGGQPVGQVAEVHDTDFRVVRSGREDVHVPYGAIRALLGDQVVLDVHTAQIDAQGWSSSQGEEPRADY